MKSKSTIGEYDMGGGLVLKGQAAMIQEDDILLFRSIDKFPDNP